jgi:hypothetical protein
MSLVRALRPRLALAAGLAVVPLMVFVPPGLAAESCTTTAANSNVCVSITDTPDPVAPDGAGGNNTFYSYTTVVRNAGRNTVSHVGVSQTVPTSVVSAESAGGPCAVDGASVSCSFGSLPRNGSATVKITVTAPAQTGQVLSSATASFSERANDKPGEDPKIDTVTVTEPTTVAANAGETWVEPGQTTIVNSDPAQPYRGRATIAGESTDHLSQGFLASLKPVAVKGGTPFDCVLGQVSLTGGVFACRNGGWLLANIRDGQTFDPPLQFHLAWDASQGSLLQTRENFVVFYAKDAGASTPIQRFGPCSANPRPCYVNLVGNTGQAWSLDLISDHNGYMR